MNKGARTICRQLC